MTQKSPHPQPPQAVIPVQRLSPIPHPLSPCHAFTLIELLVVVAIVSILAAITVPAIKTLSKSNDQSQATSLVRAMITNARAIAISQHRMAGVVFFEETTTYSRPANIGQTAMQLFVEVYDQQGFHNAYPPPLIPLTAPAFIIYSTTRQYLPSGVKLAALTDAVGANVETGNGFTTTPARAILFDANGQLLLRGSLAAPPPPASPTPGAYGDNSAYGDWNFGGVTGVANAFSSPGFFLYNKAEYDVQTFPNTAAGNTQRAQWMEQHADVILINANTGTIIQ